MAPRQNKQKTHNSFTRRPNLKKFLITSENQNSSCYNNSELNLEDKFEKIKGKLIFKNRKLYLFLIDTNNFIDVKLFFSFISYFVVFIPLKFIVDLKIEVANLDFKVVIF